MTAATKAQKAVLDAIYAIMQETGRAATMQEVAKRIGKAVSTVHAHIASLRALGLITKSGLQPGDGAAGEGWRRGATYVGTEVIRVLVEHQVEPPVMTAVRHAISDAISQGK